VNQPPEEYVVVTEPQLLRFSQNCFESAGLRGDHAQLISRLLVNSDLRGVRSHGTRQVDGYCAAFEAGQLNPDPTVSVINDHGAVVAMDGDGSLGYLPMVRATEAAIERAKQHGLGMATVRSIGHYGSAGHYCRMCMEADCIGFSVQGSRNHGRANPDRLPSDPKPPLAFFGNPPICFAIPGRDSPGVVLDAATRILADYQRGPEFEELIPLIPAAFFKSVGYTAIAALLGGGLAGVSGGEGTVHERWPRARSGGMILAIRIDAAVDLDAFHSEVDRMVRDVAESFEPFPGHDRALLPGAIEAERMAQHRLDGIKFGAMEQEAVRRVCERHTVTLPWDDRANA
jgi:LDH2 family malate/lactate/ureidoglycolate dehydrogenase